MRAWLPCLALIVGCSSSAPSSLGDDASTTDVAIEASLEAATDASSDGDPAAGCASTFGDALTSAFGRLDGVVTAIVPASNTTCAQGTSPTHVVVQVKSLGAVYRMVVNVQSDRGTDVDVRFAAIDHPVLSPWAEGWHAPETVDYPTTLMVHSGTTFTPTKKDDLIAKIVSAVPIGAEVSVYATSSGGSSAHLVHRHESNDDGAIVVDPRGSSPRWLLFHFVEQTF